MSKQTLTEKKEEQGSQAHVDSSVQLRWGVKTKAHGSLAMCINALSGKKFSAQILDPGDSSAVNLILSYHVINISN